MIQYSVLSAIQRVDIATAIFLFLILFGFARTVLLGQVLDSKNVVFLTVLFAIWLFLVRVFTNYTMMPFIEEKLNPYPASTTTNTDDSA
jgi:hypothetical protein